MGRSAPTDGARLDNLLCQVLTVPQNVDPLELREIRQELGVPLLHRCSSLYLQSILPEIAQLRTGTLFGEALTP